MKRLLRVLSILGALLLDAALTGCGANQFLGTAMASNPAPPAVLPVQAASMHGRVASAQTPVVGVNLQLYTAGTSDYGSASLYNGGTSLLGTHALTTDAKGNFDITGAYTCPSPSTLVYLVATGGSALPGHAANPNLALMAALGSCGGLNGNTLIAINELTTVASVWALAPFMKGLANLGTSVTNQTGLANAFAAVNKLVDTRTATLPGPALPAGALLPVAEINTLADLLLTCIQSSGGVAGDGSPCGTLFNLTRNAGGVAPADTLTAALNIARNPAQNVAALHLLSAQSTAYQPTLGKTAPSAWTLALRYTAANTLSAPTGIAVDQSGCVWVVNQGSSTVTKLDNSGAVLSGASGYAAGQAGQGAIAIDAQGSAWVAANSNGAILRVSPTGITSTFTGGGLTDTTSIAIDGEGRIWAAGAGNTLSGFTSAGTPLAVQGFNGGGLLNAQTVAIGH